MIPRDCSYHQSEKERRRKEERGTEEAEAAVSFPHSQAGERSWAAGQGAEQGGVMVGSLGAPCPLSPRLSPKVLFKKRSKKNIFDFLGF